MNRIRPGRKRGRVAALICSAALLSGCSYAIMPKSVPPIKGYEALSLTAVSVTVRNAEKDATEYEILTDEGQNPGLRANRQAWSKRLVEALAGELARRGARVSSDAPVTLSLALPEIIFLQTSALYQLKVKVAVSTSTGWSKQYEGIAGSSRYRAWSVTAEADRWAAQALAEAVKAMLGDPEFLAHLGGKA